ncbi:MAG: LytR/AlgR family response regulator transcription factor [Sphingomonas sp.]
MRLRALLVDDEPLASRRLGAALRTIDGVEVIGSTTSAIRAVEMIARMRPDLVFLDIAMPGLDGFGVLAAVPAADRPAIVFVTAYDAHAVAAFGVDAVDYLLKPVAPDRLAISVTRARHWLRAREPGADDVEPAAIGEDSLWAHRHQEYVRVPIEQIVWLEAEGDYVRIHAGNGGGLMRITLGALEAKLDPETFVRVHRSAICRRSAVTGLRRKATGALEVSLASGDWVPVGRSYSNGLRALLRRMRAA